MSHKSSKTNNRSLEKRQQCSLTCLRFSADLTAGCIRCTDKYWHVQACQGICPSLRIAHVGKIPAPRSLPAKSMKLILPMSLPGSPPSFSFFKQNCRHSKHGSGRPQQTGSMATTTITLSSEHMQIEMFGGVFHMWLTCLSTWCLGHGSVSLRQTQLQTAPERAKFQMRQAQKWARKLVRPGSMCTPA